MTKIEVNRFRTVLQQCETELVKSSQSREALAIETSPDEFDRIQNASERDYAMGSLERRADRLRAVEAALGRLETGSFGSCTSCEEDIHPKRLAAVPWAQFCIGCQETADRLEKTPGTDPATSMSEAALSL